MYRYIVDNAVTYTPDDFVLYRESPFAVWMERLTLENPDHGILPDLHSSPPEDSAECQRAIVDTLRMEGRDVALIEWDLDEAERRRRTIAAMRDGADFIVDGQLALGALSGTANLLMRTSGYSDLGDFLYIPCDTQDKTTLQSAFRLCFLADLLHSLQGQLPPQMLVIRGDADVVPLQTEDHIYYFLAVKKRFMDDMRDFRKHVMPDPSESAHFGRWSDCASEVMKQRALREQEEAFEREQEQVVEEPVLRVAGVAGDGVVETPADASFDAVAREQGATGPAARPGAADGQTLAEQARQLDPGTFRVDAAPGRAPNLSTGAPGPALGEAAQPSAPAPRLRARQLAEQPAEEGRLGGRLRREQEQGQEQETEAGGTRQAEARKRPLPSPEPGTPASSEALRDPLGDLSFIGSGSLRSSFEVEPIEPPAHWNRSESPAVPLDLRQSDTVRGAESREECLVDGHVDGHVDGQVDSELEGHSVSGSGSDTLDEPGGRVEPGNRLRPLPDLEPPEPALLPPEDLVVAVSPRQPGKPHPLDSSGVSVNGTTSMVDFDGAPPPSLAPLPSELDAGSVPAPEQRGADPDEVAPRKPFSDSLITSRDFDQD